MIVYRAFVARHRHDRPYPAAIGTGFWLYGPYLDFEFTKLVRIAYETCSFAVFRYQAGTFGLISPKMLPDRSANPHSSFVPVSWYGVPCTYHYRSIGHVYRVGSKGVYYS